jgi:hypothetical protein
MMQEMFGWLMAQKMMLPGRKQSSQGQTYKTQKLAEIWSFLSCNSTEKPCASIRLPYSTPQLCNVFAKNTAKTLVFGLKSACRVGFAGNLGA